MGQIDRAKDLYKTVLTNLEHMGLTHSEHYATALINTGDVYVNSRELPEALQYFLRARDLLVECGLAGDYRMAALNNNISMVYRLSLIHIYGNVETEIGRACVQLSSPDFKFMSGETITLEGGMGLRP